MRKIKHILERKEKLQGEYDALIKCVDKATVKKWRDTIKGLINNRNIPHGPVGKTHRER